MELEAERVDERAVELRHRQDRPMAAFLEREGEADIRVDVAVGPPTGDQDAERTGGVHKLSRILYNAAPRETPGIPRSGSSFAPRCCCSVRARPIPRPPR